MASNNDMAVGGGLWMASWMFCIAFLNMTGTWKIIGAFFVWPYYLGEWVRTLL